MKKRTKLLAAILSACMMVIPVSAQEYSYRGSSASTTDARKFSLGQLGQSDGIMILSGDSDDSTISFNENEYGILYCTNKLRMQYDLQPLSATAKLQKAAQIRSSELPTLNSHTRPNGSDFFSVLDEVGESYTAAGENIATGYPDPVSVVKGWYGSNGHRKNMLSDDFTHLGSGYAHNASSTSRTYWTQVFTGSCSPDKIAILDNSDVNYIMTADDSIDDLGLTLGASCKHGLSVLPLTQEMCSGYNLSLTDSTQVVTVSFRGQSTTFHIAVVSQMPFVDVSKGAWFYPYVQTVFYNGLMNGKNDTQFAPGENLARAQFSLILYRMSGSPEVDAKSEFKDVADNDWYTDAVIWASKAGVVTGYTDSGLFGPGDDINREQMAVMMYRYANYCNLDTSARASLNQFKDASYVNSFAREAMQWAVAEGIITGKDNGTKLDPQGNASRAECATIISRFMDLQE